MANPGMIQAIRANQLDKVKQLFQNKESEENGPKDNALLYFAVTYNHMEITEYFLQQGCDPNGQLQSKYERTVSILPLQVVQSPEMIDLLLSYGAKVNAQATFDNRTALHSVVISTDNSEVLVQHLLKKGADPEAIDKDGDTPLHMLIEFTLRGIRTQSRISSEHEKIIKLFLDYQIDPELCNKDGRSLASFLKEREAFANRDPSFKPDLAVVAKIRDYMQTGQARSSQVILK